MYLVLPLSSRSVIIFPKLVNFVLNGVQLQSWSQSQESSEIISKLKGIVSNIKNQNKVSIFKPLIIKCFGGGPLSKKAGDKLASNGANLYTLYAM